MLNDELAIWHQYLDKLKSGDSELITSSDLSFSLKLSKERKGITEAWLSVAFSDAPEIALSRYFRFHQQEVRWLTSQLENFQSTQVQKESVKILIQELRELQDLLKRHFSRYLISDDALEDMLDKMLVNLSVAQIGCLLKLAYEAGLFPNVTVSELIRSVVLYCRTKKQLHISARSLSKEYYSVTQVTAATCRELLDQLIKRIDKIYFT